jgi:murein DD-endopeptidase MepM/ murein hydrolase activator NlpD
VITDLSHEPSSGSGDAIRTPTGHVNPSFLADYKDKRAKEVSHKTLSAVTGAMKDLSIELGELKQEIRTQHKRTGSVLESQTSRSKRGLVQVDISKKAAQTLNTGMERMSSSAYEIASSTEKFEKQTSILRSIVAQFGNYSRRSTESMMSVAKQVKHSTYETGKILSKTPGRAIAGAARGVQKGTEFISDTQAARQAEQDMKQMQEAAREHMVRMMFLGNPVLSYLGQGAIKGLSPIAKKAIEKMRAMKSNRGELDFNEGPQYKHKGGFIVAHKGAVLTNKKTGQKKRVGADEHVAVLKEGEMVLPTQNKDFLTELSNSIAKAIIKADEARVDRSKSQPLLKVSKGEYFQKFKDVLEETNYQQAEMETGTKIKVSKMKTFIRAAMPPKIPTAAKYLNELPKATALGGIHAAHYHVAKADYAAGRAEGLDKLDQSIQTNEILMAGFGLRGKMRRPKSYQSLSAKLGTFVRKQVGRPKQWSKGVMNQLMGREGEGFHGGMPELLGGGGIRKGQGQEDSFKKALESTNALLEKLIIMQSLSGGLAVQFAKTGTNVDTILKRAWLQALQENSKEKILKSQGEVVLTKAEKLKIKEEGKAERKKAKEDSPANVSWKEKRRAKKNIRFKNKANKMQSVLDKDGSASILDIMSVLQRNMSRDSVISPIEKLSKKLSKKIEPGMDYIKGKAENIKLAATETGRKAIQPFQALHGRYKEKLTHYKDALERTPLSPKRLSDILEKHGDEVIDWGRAAAIDKKSRTTEIGEIAARYSKGRKLWAEEIREELTKKYNIGRIEGLQETADYQRFQKSKRLAEDSSTIRKHIKRQKSVAASHEFSDEIESVRRDALINGVILTPEQEKSLAKSYIKEKAQLLRESDTFVEEQQRRQTARDQATTRDRYKDKFTGMSPEERDKKLKEIKERREKKQKAKNPYKLPTSIPTAQEEGGEELPIRGGEGGVNGHSGKLLSEIRDTTIKETTIVEETQGVLSKVIAPLIAAIASSSQANEEREAEKEKEGFWNKVFGKKKDEDKKKGGILENLSIFKKLGLGALAGAVLPLIAGFLSGGMEGVGSALKGVGVGGLIGGIIGLVTLGLPGAIIGFGLGSFVGGMYQNFKGMNEGETMTALAKAFKNPISVGVGGAVGGILGLVLTGFNPLGAVAGMALGGWITANMVDENGMSDTILKKKWDILNKDGFDGTMATGTIAGGILGLVLTGMNPLGFLAGAALGGFVTNQIKTIADIKNWEEFSATQKSMLTADMTGDSIGIISGAIIGGALGGPAGMLAGASLGYFLSKTLQKGLDKKFGPENDKNLEASGTQTGVGKSLHEAAMAAAGGGTSYEQKLAALEKEEATASPERKKQIQSEKEILQGKIEKLGRSTNLATTALSISKDDSMINKYRKGEGDDGRFTEFSKKDATRSQAIADAARILVQARDAGNIDPALSGSYLESMKNKPLMKDILAARDEFSSAQTNGSFPESDKQNYISRLRTILEWKGQLAQLSDYLLKDQKVLTPQEINQASNTVSSSTISGLQAFIDSPSPRAKAENRVRRLENAVVTQILASGALSDAIRMKKAGATELDFGEGTTTSPYQTEADQNLQYQKGRNLVEEVKQESYRATPWGGALDLLSFGKYKQIGKGLDELDIAGSTQGMAAEWAPLLGRGGFGMPTNGPISSFFGPRMDPLAMKPAFHRGIDIAAKNGSMVSASASGIVSFAGKKPQLGNTVEITHSNGLITGYHHLKDILVQPGQQVSAGMQIGTVGSTGRSTGPHLDFGMEMMKGGKRVPLDPMKHMGGTMDFNAKPEDPFNTTMPGVARSMAEMTTPASPPKSTPSSIASAQEIAAAPDTDRFGNRISEIAGGFGGIVGIFANLFKDIFSIIMGGGSLGDMASSAWSGIKSGASAAGSAISSGYTSVANAASNWKDPLSRGYDAIMGAGSSLWEKAKKMTMEHEGLRTSKYTDSRGFPTIGYGHLLKEGESFPGQITAEEAGALFEKDYSLAKSELISLIGPDNWAKLDPYRQAALTDMTFNLGGSGVGKFQGMWNNIWKQDWTGAANEVLDSDYAKQVRSRARTIAQLVATGAQKASPGSPTDVIEMIKSKLGAVGSSIKGGIAKSYSSVMNSNITQGLLEKWQKVKEGTKNYLSGAFWPPSGGQVTSKFGSTAGRDHPHQGIDIGGSGAIHAVLPGRVISVEDKWEPGQAGAPDKGNAVYVEHQLGNYKFISRYMHMKKGISVREGESVTAGQVLGAVGNTGHSTGPHLHFDIGDDQGAGWESKIDPQALFAPIGSMAQFAAGSMKDSVKSFSNQSLFTPSTPEDVMAQAAQGTKPPMDMGGPRARAGSLAGIETGRRSNIGGPGLSSMMNANIPSGPKGVVIDLSTMLPIQSDQLAKLQQNYQSAMTKSAALEYGSKSSTAAGNGKEVVFQNVGARPIMINNSGGNSNVSNTTEGNSGIRIQVEEVINALLGQRGYMHN